MLKKIFILSSIFVKMSLASFFSYGLNLKDMSDKEIFSRFGIIPGGKEDFEDFGGFLKQGGGVNGTYNIFKQRIFTTGNSFLYSVFLTFYVKRRLG